MTNLTHGQLEQVLNEYRERFNPYHVPAGSPRGGQFAEKPGGSRIVKPVKGTRFGKNIGELFDVETTGFSEGTVDARLNKPGGPEKETVPASIKGDVAVHKALEGKRRAVTDMPSGLLFGTFRQARPAFRAAAAIDRINRISKVKRDKNGAPQYDEDAQTAIRSIMEFATAIQ